MNTSPRHAPSVSWAARILSLGESRPTEVGFLNVNWRSTLAIFFLAAFTFRIVFLFVAPNNSTDAWSRYVAATVWLEHPSHLPPATAVDAWLPMHFWLLGGVVWITKSEMAARGLSVLLGSFTVTLLAGIADRAFNRRVAFGSALLLTFFGFHIAFSVTTSSEALTIFLIALGTYAWIRYAATASWSWALISSTALNIASLCRFESWLCGPVLALMLLPDDSGSWPAGGPSHRAWWRALGFGLFSSLGALGWLVFSYLKWGDPLELPHRTMWLNAQFQPSHHSIYFRALSVPGSIVASLNPLIAVLTLIGALRVWFESARAARATLCLALALFAFNYYNSVRYETTQARYTLLYSWLLLPFALEGLSYLISRWRWADRSRAFAIVLILFLGWQAGIAVAASYAPQPIGDHLGALSPTIPLHAEIRGLTRWLKTNREQRGAAILDDYNWESEDVFRFANLTASRTFSITQQDYDNPRKFNLRLAEFVRGQHPGLLICSPQGPIGKTWCVDPRKPVRIADSNLRLAPLWLGTHWQIYAISYY